MLLLAGLTLALPSCQDDGDDSKNGSNPALSRTFYVAGSEDSDGFDRPVVWINGIARAQGNDGSGGVCNAVAIGNDNSVYTGVISDNLSSGIYKDGEKLYNLERAGAHCGVMDIALLNDIVYSCGYDETTISSTSACVWKGQEKYISVADSKGVRAFPVKDDEIYMVADEYGNVTQPAVYRNSSRLYSLPSPENTDTHAKDAYYVNGDIYTVGEYQVKPDVNRIIVWKNDIRLYEISGADGTGCNAGAIYVNRQGNIFVGGQETDADGVKVAKIWKDGNPYLELDGGADVSEVTSVTEADGLIYACGSLSDWNGAAAIIWQEAAILYKMKPAGNNPVTRQLIIK